MATNHEARSDDVRSIELTGTVSSVPHARHQVAEDLRRTGLPPAVVENVLIVVTELVTNAILHARPLPLGDTRTGFELRWSVSGIDVHVGVSDGGGAASPQVKSPTAIDNAGRGLAIVDAVAREWAIHTESDRVTIQAVVGP